MSAKTARTLMKSIQTNFVPEMKLMQNRLETNIKSLRNTKIPSFEQIVGSAAQTLNATTGYDEIAAQKSLVDKYHADLSRISTEQSIASESHLKLTEECAATNKKMASLLHRKTEWTSNDLDRFTVLFKQEISQTESLAEARAKVVNSSKQHADAMAIYLDSLRERYMVESVYADKMRRAGMFWTAVLVCVHLCVFIGVTLYTEPRRARKFQNAVRESVKEQVSGFDANLALVVENNREIRQHLLSNPITSMNTDTINTEIVDRDNWALGYMANLGVNHYFLQGIIFGGIFTFFLAR
jgi:hypothetical protein